jgi:basic membrane lipoprotein Med (substrate-binding protein (PBP1-ABC) superfamily)
MTDQVYGKKPVIGSLVYDYTSAVELALTILENGNGEWPEGNSTMYLGAEENGIRLLPEGEGWKFRNFTEEDYKALYADIAEGKIIIPRTDEIGEIPFTVEYS